MKNSNAVPLRKRLYFLVPGTILGITGGFLYYHFYGCTNGCPINSNPYLSMIWGGLIGYLLTDIIADKFYTPKTEDKKEEENA